MLKISCQRLFNTPSHTAIKFHQNQGFTTLELKEPTKVKQRRTRICSFYSLCKPTDSTKHLTFVTSTFSNYFKEKIFWGEIKSTLYQLTFLWSESISSHFANFTELSMNQKTWVDENKVMMCLGSVFGGKVTTY